MASYLRALREQNPITIFSLPNKKISLCVFSLCAIWVKYCPDPVNIRNINAITIFSLPNRKISLCVFSLCAIWVKYCPDPVNIRTTWKKILSFYPRYDAMSEKTISRYCPFKGIDQWEKRWVELCINRKVSLQAIHAEIFKKKLCRPPFCERAKTTRRRVFLLFEYNNCCQITPQCLRDIINPRNLHTTYSIYHIPYLGCSVA
jgi:hypothetical protein